MICIRKLAAVDMAWLGPRLVVTEYALGVFLPLGLGLLSLRSSLGGLALSWPELLGIWLITIAANYIPLFIYAVMIARAGTVKEEGQSEIARATKYGVQQLIILIPFLVVIVALGQEFRQGNEIE
jgi:hypothetical protein